MQMQDFSLNLRMNIVPTVAQRGRHALILLRNSAGNFILGTKNIYPPGISRMAGGGIEEGEEPNKAAPRELAEETGLNANENDLIHLATIVANITDAHEKLTLFTTYLYFYDCGNQAYTASDDLQGLVELSETQLEELIQLYFALPKLVDSQINAAWYDYGLLYGRIHQIALNTWHALPQKNS